MNKEPNLRFIHIKKKEGVIVQFKNQFGNTR